MIRTMRRPEGPGDVQAGPLGGRRRPPVPTAEAEGPGQLGDELVQLLAARLRLVQAALLQGLVDVGPQLLDPPAVGGPGGPVEHGAGVAQRPAVDGRRQAATPSTRSTRSSTWRSPRLATSSAR